VTDRLTSNSVCTHQPNNCYNYYYNNYYYNYNNYTLQNSHRLSVIDRLTSNSPDTPGKQLIQLLLLELQLLQQLHKEKQLETITGRHTDQQLTLHRNTPAKQILLLVTTTTTTTMTTHGDEKKQPLTITD